MCAPAGEGAYLCQMKDLQLRQTGLDNIVCSVPYDLRLGLAPLSIESLDSQGAQPS